MWQYTPGGDWSPWYSLGGRLAAYSGVFASYYENTNGGAIRGDLITTDVEHAGGR